MSKGKRSPPGSLSYGRWPQTHAPAPAHCSEAGDGNPSCSLTPCPKASWCEQPTEPERGGMAAPGGRGCPVTILSLTGVGTTLHISGPYRGAWRSSWAILSCVTRRPPGTWGSWRTRGASGSFSTLIALEEVHTDMVRRSGLSKPPAA